MNVINSSFCLFSLPVENIRENFFQLEKDLSTLFAKPFNLVPLPDAAPLEIPRITAVSINGFSSLNISLNSYQFVTRFDKVYSSDWNKCRDYIKDRLYKIYDILDPFFKKKLYCGLTVNLIKNLSDKDNAIDILLNNLTKFSSKNEIYDIDNKYTFVKNKNYYVNIRVYNQRLSINNILPGTLKENEQQNNIGILLDINDKYGFNYEPNYVSNKEKIDNIIEIADDIVFNKLENFIMKGEI